MDIYKMDAEERYAAVQVLVELCRNHYTLFQKMRMPDHVRTCVEDIVTRKASHYDPEGPRLQQEAWECLIEALNLKHDDEPKHVRIHFPFEEDLNRAVDAYYHDERLCDYKIDSDGGQSLIVPETSLSVLDDLKIPYNRD